jgi:hypothetical protein
VEHSPGPVDKSQLIREHLSQLQGIRQRQRASLEATNRPHTREHRVGVADC